MLVSSLPLEQRKFEVPEQTAQTYSLPFLVQYIINI